MESGVHERVPAPFHARYYAILIHTRALSFPPTPPPSASFVYIACKGKENRSCRWIPFIASIIALLDIVLLLEYTYICIYRFADIYILYFALHVQNLTFFFFFVRIFNRNDEIIIGSKGRDRGWFDGRHRGWTRKLKVERWIEGRGFEACCSYNEERSNLTLLRVVLSSRVPFSTNPHRVVLSPPFLRCNLRPHRSALVYLDPAEVIAWLNTSSVGFTFAVHDAHGEISNVIKFRCKTWTQGPS